MDWCRLTALDVLSEEWTLLDKKSIASITIHVSPLLRFRQTKGETYIDKEKGYMDGREISLSKRLQEIGSLILDTVYPCSCAVLCCNKSDYSDTKYLFGYKVFSKWCCKTSNDFMFYAREKIDNKDKRIV